MLIDKVERGDFSAVLFSFIDRYSMKRNNLIKRKMKEEEKFNFKVKKKNKIIEDVGEKEGGCCWSLNDHK